MSNLSSAAAQKAMFSVGGPVDLRKYTKLKPAVAEQLRCDAEIDLSGLKEFTPELAAAFKYHREGLILNGLKNLSAATAEALKNNFQGKLTMGGLEELDDQAALFLSQREAGSEPYRYWPKVVLEGMRKLSDSEGHLALFEKLASSETYKTIPFKEISPKQAEILTRRADKIDLWKIERITPEVAKILATTAKTISMNFLRTISPEEAAGFAGHTGHLSLTGLEKIDDAVAMSLSRHKGSLSLSGLEEMTDTPGFVALAESLATNEKSSASGITKVGPKIAEIFSIRPSLCYNLKAFEDSEGHKKLLRAFCAAEDKKTVELWGINSIPDPVLQILVECPKKIAVNSLSQWTEEPAHIRLAERMVQDSLAGDVTDSLYINGERFPDKIAAIFASAPKATFSNLKELDASPGNISLSQKLADSGAWLSLRKISAPAAKILRANSPNNLSTGELVELDAENFPVLFPPGSPVYLSSLKTLPDDVAAQMADPRSVSLDGLEELSLPAALSLSRGEGSLSLRGLKKISNDVLQALAQRKGELNLGGISELSVDQSLILETHKGGLLLDGLVTASQESLEIIASVDPEKTLSLESVAEVSDEVAAKLAQRIGSVRLSSIGELSDSPGHVALAEKLASSTWKIELKAIASISPAAAAKFLGVSDISLGGLRKMDVALAKVFSSYAGTLKLRDLEELSLEASQELGKAPCDQMGMELGFIDNLPDDVFAALALSKQKLSFKARHLSPEKARICSRVPSLYIEKLRTIEPEAAQCFKGYKGSIYLSNLEHLSAEAAAALRKLGRKLSTTRSGEYALSTGL